MSSLYTPEQYADLVISKVEADHHAKTGEFIHLGRYRGAIAAQFRQAVTDAIEQSLATWRAARDQDVEADLEVHLRKHIPKE